MSTNYWLDFLTTTEHALLMTTITKPASLDDVRHLGTIPVWSATKPDAADVLGISRSQAYGLARTGEIPTLRLGKGRVVVPVPLLLAMLGDRPTPVT